MRRSVVPCIVASAILTACGGSVTPTAPPLHTPMPSASPLAREISTDPLTDSAGQHATEVEPSAAVWGSTIVAAFQVGRHFTTGASGIGVAASHDGGATWSNTLLPAQTVASTPRGSAISASDPAVSYDAAHARWLVVSLPIAGTTLLGPYVASSPDGMQWSAPAHVPPGPALADKTWIACDDGTASRFYGRCYVVWDDGGAQGALRVSASDDGGATWSVSNQVSGAYGVGAQPLVRADGTIVLVFEDFNEQSILSASSIDGGVSWSAPQTITKITGHVAAGGLRAGFLQSAVIDASGVAYAVWPDCRFRVGCTQNDLLLTRSVDGRNWTPPARIAVDSAASSNDHFITGLAADPSIPGRLALTYYEYSQANCTASTCQLFAALSTSSNGGVTWSASTILSGPMHLAWLAQTAEGAMVGDYAAAVFAGGRAHALFTAASAPSGALLAEGTYYSL
ncbi:MAG TPA: sialidase family protein [Candidatus Baltobacteraceae bacterium]|nr:sialidase family protein [Candidatus Baltobacteraceae bacterium]